jgi:hypothetical protein
MKFQLELTDTFGGEANYCWVKRRELDVPDDLSGRALVRRSKRLLEVSHMAHRKTDYGDALRLDFPGVCIVMFITPTY